MSASQSRIEMIPITRIHVINPRARNKHQHKEIVDNIEAVGLKRPVTVSRRVVDGNVRYDLACGEGRLEAYQMLGETEIPARVIEAPEADCLLMSLVENIARRQHRPIDLMSEVGRLQKLGYSDAEIARKTGNSPVWVNTIVMLLERGEERLVSAVETGLISIQLAANIARSDHAEVQNMLLEAYSSGKIKGRKLSAVRRMLDLRMTSGKILSGGGKHKEKRQVTSADLLRVYQREAEKQRLFAKKSAFTQARLLFLVEALKDLLSDEGFRTLLRAEKLATMPRALAMRVSGEATI